MNVRLDKASTVRRMRADAARAKVTKLRDRRRFFETPVPTGQTSKVVAADTDRTIFPTTVRTPGAGGVLLDAAHNSKIGGDVMVGWLKGARIFQLTLEERATCPRSCQHWRTCYGNGMQLAKRWQHGPELMAAIIADVERLTGEHGRILVRLHTLGDFYSVGYVALWENLLELFPGLHCFGFTAWDQDTDIGAEIEHVRNRFGRRFSIRHSGRSGDWGSFTIDFPTERKTLGDAIVCPEQRDAMNGTGQRRHCGNCGVCWSTIDPIVFVEH